MSMHKKPLTKLEHDGLLAHGLDIGTPSQISDVFRQGIAYALANAPTVDIAKLFEGYKAPEPLPVIPLTHEQLNTPYEAGRTVQREGWVSVEDRVPDDGIYCIAAIIKNNEIWNWNKARYSSTAKRWFNGNKADQDFTHWQPLPAAPTDKE